jgi:hypothetical protein
LKLKKLSIRSSEDLPPLKIYLQHSTYDDSLYISLIPFQSKATVEFETPVVQVMPDQMVGFDIGSLDGTDGRGNIFSYFLKKGKSAT